MSDQRRLFISHTAEDSDFARKLARLMKDRGASVFLDMDIAPGMPWPDALRTEIERATALLLVIPSRHAANRNNLLFEAGVAKALGKPILAVLPSNRRTASIELPTDIAGVLILDADRRTLESIADTLLQAIPEHYAEPAIAK
jgi:TIR domain